MDRAPKLWDKGVQHPVTVEPYGVLDKPQLRLGTAASLADLGQEYAFFSPALLYISGLFNDQLLSAFLFEYGVEVKFFWRKFRVPLFRGLELPDGDADWNRALWAVASEHWPAFADFACSLCVHNTDTGDVCRFGIQSVRVVDPLALEMRGLLAGVVPSVEVSVFGINGEHYQLAMRPGQDSLIDPPRLCRFPALGKMRYVADAVRRGQDPELAGLKYDVNFHKGACRRE